MHFIAVIIALLVETFYKPITHWRNYQWFLDFTGWIHEKLSGHKFRDGPAGVVLELGVIVVACWIIIAMLEGVGVFFGFIIATIVLLYCVGPRDLEEDLNDYVNSLKHDDLDGSLYYAERITGYPIAEGPKEAMQHVKREIFLQANKRMLSILFWFVVMGPVGVLMFRLCDVKNSALRDEQSEYAHSYRRLFYILSWVPARFAILGYAVVGNFMDTMKHWNSLDDIWNADSDELVVKSAMGSLKLDEEQEDPDHEIEPDDLLISMALVKRMVVFWIAVLGVMTLTGTLFS